MLSYMHACSTYYHQGSDLCEDLDTFLKTLAEEVRYEKSNLHLYR